MMKRNLTTPAALLIGAALSAPAMAADPVFYAGVNAGMNATEFEPSTSTDVSGNITKSEETGSASGPAYGGTAGVKFPISTGYLGLEANVADSGAEYEKTQSINGQTTLDQKISSDLSYGVSGILAFNVNAHTQVYGIAGYQITDVEAKTSTRDTGTGDITSDSFNDDFGGIRVGVGLETAITSSLSTRLEWTSTSYSSEDFETDTANGVVDTELKGTENRITVGVIGHF